MDLGLHLRVIWRFRVIVAIGVVLAVVLAFLSYARVSFAGGSPTVSYRQAETWDASSTVFLTQEGFPYGYSITPSAPVTLPGAGGSTVTPQYGNVGTFVQLAADYAPFVQSDAFQAMLRRRVAFNGLIDAAPVVNNHQTALPYITIVGYARTRPQAVTLANAAAAVFSEYLVREQNANHVPQSSRVTAEVFSRAHNATLSAGRKKTTPIVVFLAVLIAAVGLAFVLENLRPRIRSVAAADQLSEAVSARRSA